MKVLEVDSKDLEFNVEKIKQRAGNSKIIAVVKGNGYGLGLREFTSFLIKHGISDFAVSSVDEAIELSQVCLDCNILCMEATCVESELEMLLESNVTITIGNADTARFLNQLAKEKKVKANVQLKIDTGFSRYGFDCDNKEAILRTIRENASLLVTGIYSHFACAYSKKTEYTKLQFERFMSIKDFLEKNNIQISMYHIANSSAFLKYQSMYLDAVRIGSAFLGRVSVKNTVGLKRIGVLKSNVVSVKNIKNGTPIGYSNSEIAKRDTTLAIVPIGYSDGFNIEKKNDTFKIIDKIRMLKNDFVGVFKDNRIYVLINEKRFPIIGMVGMNHIAVDITGSDVKIDDKVKIDVSPILISSKIRREYI